MSVETLRRAAQLMRERAEAANAGPWTAEPIGSEGYRVYGAPAVGITPRHKRRPVVAACTWEPFLASKADAEHIAAWHPAVAIAVAAWLDSEAMYVEDFGLAADVTTAHAVAVAEAYLGEGASL
ncbi:MAG TPA: hypothetical protein VGF17_15485 [Phytomonospora sp.]